MWIPNGSPILTPNFSWHFSLGVWETNTVKMQLLTYAMILPANIWNTQPKVTSVWMHKRRCSGNSDNKLVWIPPQILAQYPEKRKSCKILGMAWLSIKIIKQWLRKQNEIKTSLDGHDFNPSCENHSSKKQHKCIIKTSGHDISAYQGTQD